MPGSPTFRRTKKLYEGGSSVRVQLRSEGAVFQQVAVQLSTSRVQPSAV
jgi:hypothetical protein